MVFNDISKLYLPSLTQSSSANNYLFSQKDIVLNAIIHQPLVFVIGFPRAIPFCITLYLSRSDSITVEGHLEYSGYASWNNNTPGNRHKLKPSRTSHEM